MSEVPTGTKSDTDTSRLTPTVAEIDLRTLRHNIKVLQRRAAPAQLLGVVKANAYGHGAVPVARVLFEGGVRHFGVARIPEAIQLREVGLEGSILVFGAPLPDHVPAYARYQLDLTVASRSIAEAVVTAARELGPVRVHVKVDTGMGRLGLTPDEALEVVRLLDAAPGITLAGLWTHFATATEEADAYALSQLEVFESMERDIGDAFERIHVAHSGALFTLGDRVATDRMLVRPGISLYGLSTSPGADVLQPLMRFTSRVIQIKTVEPGASISYGCTWRAPHRTRIATVAAGYADGYRRALSNRAEVGIGGRRYPVAGRVCMDLFMIDLGPPGSAAVGEGDEVVLFGTGGPSAIDVAGWADTIPYEICCGISARVPRTYVSPA